MPIANAGVVAAEEREHVGHLLTRYPENLSAREADDVENWFDRVATEADHRALAADPLISAHYKAFRAAQDQASGPRKIGRTLLVVGVATAVAGALSLLAP